MKDEDAGERREINKRKGHLMAERCNYIKDDGVVDERVMEGGRKREVEGNHLLSKTEKRNGLFSWETCFSDGWLTRQIAVLSETRCVK